MKTLQRFLGVGVAVALLGLNVVIADVRTESTRVPLTFPLDVGDGSVDMPDISYDVLGSAGGEAAQATCAMTPGGTSPNLLLEPPIVPLPNFDRLTNVPRESLAPLAPLARPRTNYTPNRRPYRDPPPQDPPPPPVPEPTTLLIVGLGIGALAVARRQGKQMFRH